MIRTACSRLPPVPEKQTHLALAELLHRTVKKSDWEWTHIPLGGKRDIVTAAQLQRMGTKPGWPDFMFVHRLGFLYFLELKSSDGWLSPEQSAFHRKMRNFANVHCAVARSFEEAISYLKGWGVLPNVHAEGSRDAQGNPRQATQGEKSAV